MKQENFPTFRCNRKSIRTCFLSLIKNLGYDLKKQVMIQKKKLRNLGETHSEKK